MKERILNFFETEVEYYLMTTKAVYKMDGNNLVVESSSSSSFGDRSETQVFDKK